MSSKGQDKVIHIVVVGVSGPESLRGAVGVGKSSLCNRFIRPNADDYQPEDHISTISQSDFSGRVINNDHFLYWGNVTKRNEEGLVHFSVIEQTEFVDDQSFAPLRGSNTAPYHKRCAVTKLTSAEKLMYICKYQLGEEDGYEKVVLPEPKFTVDGYILVFDVNSKVRGRPIQKQLEFLGILHQTIAKTKRPILVVATKCDEADDHYLKEARTFATKIKAPIVETSATEAVNVDLAFITLAQLVDKTKGRPREVPFSEAIKVRKDLLDNVTDAYAQMLKNDVRDYHTKWTDKKKEYAKTKQPYLQYVQYLGTTNAKKMFERHKKKLKEEHLRKKQLQYLTMLPKALEDIFPNLETIAERTWEQCKVAVNDHTKFQEWFIILDEEWKFSTYIDETINQQIPYDFLDTNNEECKTVFLKHVERLQAIKRKERMKAEYKKLLVALKDVVTPGRKIDDTVTHLANEESFRALNDEERLVIYEQHQKEIQKVAFKQFQEMLYERADLFDQFETMHKSKYIMAAQDVEEDLKEEKRYKALSELISERKVMLYKHIAFISNPTQDTCPSHDRCMDKLIQGCIERGVPRSPVKDPVNKWQTDTNGKLNVVLLGEDGLADELANEIRLQSCDDDYTLDGALHSLDLRPIEGDVSQPRNYLATDFFSPQGCICTFTSLFSFQYVKTCLEKTLLANNNDERYASLRNLPVVLMFARDVSVPDSDLWRIKDDACRLQERLNQCSIIEMPMDESVIWHGKKFHESQIQKAFRFIVTTRKMSEGLDNMDGLDEDEPDLRIGMALMCGDQFLPDLVLGPLLGHDTCFQTPDLEQSITLDLFLGTERKKIDVDVMSYHQNTLYRDDIHHGYILVYSTKRKASFETMKNFLDSYDNVPTLIVGVDLDTQCKSGDYETQVLRLEGHNLAESKKEHCKFLPAGLAIQGQPLAYSVFLKEVYDKRFDTETIYDTVQDLPGLDTNRFQARTPSVSDEDPSNMYALPQQQYRTTPDKPKGYDNDNTYDSFSRPSPFARTPIQSVPIKGSSYAYTYGQYTKTSSLPRRHSDLGEHPLEELYAYATSTPDRNRFRASTDVVEGSNDSFHQDLYAQVNKTHKRSGSAEPPPSAPSPISLQEEDEEAYAQVDRFRRPDKSLSPKQSPKQTPKHKQEEGELYAQVNRSRNKSKNTTPRSNNNRQQPPDEEGGLYAQVNKSRNRDTAPKNSNPQQPDDDAGGLYAKVNKSRNKDTTPKNNNTQQPNDDEGWVDCSVYDTSGTSTFINQQRRSLPPDDPNALYAVVPRGPGDGDEGGMTPNPIYESVENKPKKKPPPPIKPKPQYNKQKLNMKRYEQVANTINRNRDTLRPSDLTFQARNKNIPLATPDKDTYSTPVDAVRYDVIRGFVGNNSDYAEPYNSLPPGLRQRIRGKTPSTGDSPNDGDLHTPPGVNKAKKKPMVPPRSSIKSPPSDSALINELKGVIGEDLNRSNRSFSEDPARHTSSESDSMSSMDALNTTRDSSVRKRKSVRRRKGPPRPRDEYPEPIDFTYVPKDQNTMPEPDDPGEHGVGKVSRSDERRLKKLERAQKKAMEKKARLQKKEEEKRARHQKKFRKGSQPAPPQKPKGPPIETLVGPGERIPPFVVLCLDYIEQEGLKIEGLYRVPGKGADSDALISKFDEDKTVDISEMKISVHAVATAIKQFFSQLPEPLVPRDTQEEFLNQFKGGENFRSALPELMDKLPEVNRNVFAFIMLHLNRIMQNSAVNKMTAENLSTCWWPTLLHPDYKSLEEMANHAPLQNVVITCIQDAPELFPIINPVDTPVDEPTPGSEEMEFRPDSDISMMTTPSEE